MDRDQFAQRFHQAAALAHEFAQRFVVEALPQPLLFHVRLNCSYDANPLHVDERLFPEDGSAERALELLRCTEQEVIDTLWRDGLVPEWIDVCVAGILPNASLIEVQCCGRFTANADLLYHQEAGYPPFQVTGPWYPPDHDQDSKLSLSARPQCCSFDELELINLPPGAWAGPDFAHRTRGLKHLRLQSQPTLVLPTEWPRALINLHITAPAVDGGPIPSNVYCWMHQSCLHARGPG